MELKLGYSQYVDEDIIDMIDDGESCSCKFTTNHLEYENDKKDNRYISRIKNVKMVFPMQGGGCIILRGNLGCSFAHPYGGEFFVFKAYVDKMTDYNSIRGVEDEVLFSNHPIGIDAMQEVLAKMVKSRKFEYNMSQFDEFMDIFGYYKTLSGELNNDISYKIVYMSDPYYFVPVDVKDIEVEESNRIVNADGIVVGYTLEEYKFELLSSEQQDKVRTLVDVRIYGDERTLKKLKRFSDNIYVSNIEKVNDENARELVDFDLKIIRKYNDGYVVSGEINSDEDEFKYLNLYDMGQKIKLESIDNSLRLIHQGASGAAAELLEYIIGSKRMPSGRRTTRIAAAKKKYMENLDESQKAAFLMATDGSPVSLIKGPPGTGKTYVINSIVQYITKELGEKVVISSQTHVAIDNVLDKLMENYDLIIPNRITNRRNKYSDKEIDFTLYKTWAKKFSQHNERCKKKKLSATIQADIDRFKGVERFKFSENTSLSDYSVLGATTTTSAIGGKRGLELLDGYDWLIIDEVSKCPITEVLRYLPYIKKIIMVGDDFQLAPLLEFTKEEVQDLPSFDEDKFDKLKGIYEDSVFAKTLQKAEDAGRLVRLNVNNRSVKSVLNAYNIFYNYELENKREEVNPNKTQFSDEAPKVFREKDVFFVDVRNGKEARHGTSRYNVEELAATATLLEDIMRTVVNPQTVTMSAIFPYAAQIEKFQKNNLELINSAKKLFKSFEIDTVDAFQGRETDIVLVNTVVTDPSQRNFLNDFRRINVSMSRARDKLFVFGNPTTLSKIEMQVSGGAKRKYFGEIIQDIRRYDGWIEYKGGYNYESASTANVKAK